MLFLSSQGIGIKYLIIYIADTGIMDEGVSHLAKNKWKNLRTLFLRMKNST